MTCIIRSAYPLVLVILLYARFGALDQSASRLLAVSRMCLDYGSDSNEVSGLAML